MGPWRRTCAVLATALWPLVCRTPLSAVVPPRRPQVHHGFGSTLVRGIFANWLVGVATWQANAALDLTGKAVAIWCAARLLVSVRGMRVHARSARPPWLPFAAPHALPPVLARHAHPSCSVRPPACRRLPISAFAMLGFEHSIANQYLLPMATALCRRHEADGVAPPSPCLGSYEIAVGNLIPATIGNWIGGAVCVATVYAFAFGRPNAALNARADAAAGALRAWRCARAGRGGGARGRGVRA
jgi:hypothetical protein